MEKLTLEIDLANLIKQHIETTIDIFINKENETYGYWAHNLKGVIQDKLADEFVKRYSEEIFSNIARDETLTILIRERVIAKA